MHIFPTRVGVFFRRHRVFISFLIPALILLIALPLTIYLLSRPTGIRSHAQSANCLPDSNLVNPCRPWFGAAAAGNPSAPSSSQLDQFGYVEKIIGHPLD